MSSKQTPVLSLQVVRRKGKARVYPNHEVRQTDLSECSKQISIEHSLL